jgi:hypothetical protein
VRAADGTAVLGALLALALAAPACSSSGRGGASPVAVPAADVDGPPAGPPAAAAPAAVPLPDDLEPAPAANVDGGPDAGTVTIKLLADARRQARVTWGRKDLGVAPLEIVRPRGSAPLDLTVQAPGCLPLHTRVFTDRDDTLSLRLYTERDAIALPGYSPEAAPTPSSPTKTRRQN